MSDNLSKKRKVSEPVEVVRLRCLGFCGADDSVEPGLLAAISAQHSWVEWGVLFRPDKEGLPRYASESWLKQLGTVNAARTMRLAGHLCSTRVDELLRGETKFVRQMHEQVGFRRFQINATAPNGVDTSVFSTDSGAAKCVAALRQVFASLPEVEFIIQRNVATKPLWERLVDAPPPNISILFDDSMGLGVSTTTWPAPPSDGNLLFGYAGGLSPVNIKEQVCWRRQRACARTARAYVDPAMPHTPDDLHVKERAGACVPRLWSPSFACLCMLALGSRRMQALAQPAYRADSCVRRGRTQLGIMGVTAPGRVLWVDMETSLRTVLKSEADIFDANKAMACVRAVLEVGIEVGVQPR